MKRLKGRRRRLLVYMTVSTTVFFVVSPGIALADEIVEPVDATVTVDPTKWIRRSQSRPDATVKTLHPMRRYRPDAGTTVRPDPMRRSDPTRCDGHDPTPDATVRTRHRMRRSGPDTGCDGHGPDAEAPVAVDPAPRPVSDPIADQVSPVVDEPAPDPIPRPVSEPIADQIPTVVDQPAPDRDPTSGVQPIADQIPTVVDEPALDPVTDPASGPAPETALEPFPEVVSDPIADLITDSGGGPTPEAAIEPFPEVATDPIVEAVTDPIPELVTDPVPELVEPIPAPIVEAIPAPIVEAIPAPVVAPEAVAPTVVDEAPMTATASTELFFTDDGALPRITSEDLPEKLQDDPFNAPQHEGIALTPAATVLMSSFATPSKVGSVQVDDPASCSGLGSTPCGVRTSPNDPGSFVQSIAELLRQLALTGRVRSIF